MSQRKVKQKRNNSAGEQPMGRAGNWEIASTDYGMILNKLDHGCWYGTPGFPIEELSDLKACIESAIETHCEMVASDAINQLIEEGMLEEKVVDGETSFQLTERGESAGRSELSKPADDEVRDAL